MKNRWPFLLACVFWLALDTAFDEVDEGTAMFKLVPTPSELPVEGTFVPLNIYGQALPSDRCLRLADQASRMLRGDIPLQPLLPITP